MPIRQVSLFPPLHQRAVQYVKGVGPARAQQLARLGIVSLEDLLWTVPRRYEDRSRFVAIGQLLPGQTATLRGRIVSLSIRRGRVGQPIVEAAIADGTGTVPCVWFHQPYLAKWLRAGEELIVYGRVEAMGRTRMRVIHPELERIESGEGESSDDASLHTGRIVPIHPLTAGVSPRWFRRLVHTVLEQAGDEVEEMLPEALCRRHGFESLAWSLAQVHFPDKESTVVKARRRLVFEEWFILHAALAMRRARLTARAKPQRYQPEGVLVARFLRALPFALTASQRRVFEELTRELCQPTPMLRLLQGDVGCGKTVVAAALMAVVVQSGYQAALMAPTELLAEQHARVLAGYFEPLGVAVRLLSQGTPSAKRAPILQAIASGRAQVIVGTHALIQSAVSFARLAFVIVDEQHKFGVAQRSALAGKAAVPDVLVMTATPIPRTLALSAFGDLACSTIAELPPGRLPVCTRWLSEPQRPEAYRLMQEALTRGHQGYVVYPLVEAHESNALKAATQMAQHLQRVVFPKARVGLLHGRMRPAQKEQVMREFLDGSIQVLVSTIIVEVGLDVPNAMVMLIEHPERFGLAQLHQLRGRIGRAAAQQATCLLISPAMVAPEDPLHQRLVAFVETTDGFALAERDLELRGPGDLLGRTQHGWLRFRVASLTQDRELFEAAREEAAALVARDPTLIDPSHALLKQRLARWARPRSASSTQ